MKQEIKERVGKIRKGEVPEGYMKTKVGIVPNEWKEKMFNDIIFDFIGGAPLTPNDFKDNGIKVLPKRGVTRGGILVIEKDKMQYCSNQYAENHETNLVDNTYTIIVLRDLVPSGPNIGLMVKIDSNDNFILAQGVYGFKVKDELVSSHFLIHLSNGNGYRKLMNNIMVGSTQVHITNTTFLKLHISLPSFPEQQKIAEILSTWDKAVELKEKLIEEKKKLRIAIVTNLLFGLKRFDEFIKSHKYIPTKYINIPEDWDFIKISDIATEVSEKNGNNDELPVLSCTKHSGLVDSLRYFKKRIFSEDTSTYKQVKKNQFVYATNHIDEGSIGCQNLYENSLVSPMYTVFKTNSKVNNDFLFSLLKTRLYIFIYQVNMSASVDRRGSLRWNEFSKIRIPLPDIAEQNKIVESIRLVDNDIDLLNTELNKLKEQKRGLMQLLLTGIVRVEVD